jgi:hypothetical protein
MKWVTTLKTTRFNRLLTWKNNTWIRIWFRLGVAVSGPLVLFTPILYGFMGYWMYYSIVPFELPSYFVGSSMFLPYGNSPFTLLIPGLSLSLQATLFWIAALIVSTVWHELGHAVAATNEHVRLKCTGFFLFLIIPGAYVSLDTNQFEAVAPLSRWTIAAAGSWHNLVLSWVSHSVLNQLPVLFSSLFTHSGTSVMLLQAVDGNGKTLYPHLAITHINDRPILNGIAGYQEIVSTLHYPYSGPFRCIDSPQKSPKCCQSQMLSSKLECLWDIESVYSYATVPQLKLTNVVPQGCFDLSESFLTGDPCSSSRDCDSVCVGPFHTGTQRYIHFRLEDPLHPERRYEMNLIGNPLELHSAGISA